MITYNEYKKRSKNASCLVFGDLMLDKYIYGDVGRISPEAPVPVVRIDREDAVPGGAANVASSIQAMGISTKVIGRIGNDRNGILLQKKLEAAGVQFRGMICDKVRTTTKTRVIGLNQQVVRVDQEDTFEMQGTDLEKVWEILEEEIQRADILIISDYHKGVCTDELSRRIMKAAHMSGKSVLVDSKVKDWTRYTGADLITPNFKEFKEAIDAACSNTEGEIVNHALELCRKYSLGGILVTRSQYGMTYIGKDGNFYTYDADAREVFDVSGAGDTVMAAIAAFLSAGVPLREAVCAANTAAGIAVSKFGTYNVAAQELFSVWKQKGHNGSIPAILNQEEAAAFCRKCFLRGEKVVFTNGCFDILHRGHIEYLNKARSLGDRLIVGVNTDRSVKKLKGEHRPVNNQDDRAFLLAALGCVDAVVLFDEDTPYRLIQYLKPDVLVKGGDYRPEDVVGRDLVDEVVIVPFVEGYSTTKVIEDLK